MATSLRLALEIFSGLKDCASKLDEDEKALIFGPEAATILTQTNLCQQNKSIRRWAVDTMMETLTREH